MSDTIVLVLPELTGQENLIGQVEEENAHILVGRYE
jgi:hypothetical protein